MVRNRNRVEGSIRSIGMATLGVDRVTKARLKRLAGDMPICAKVRELVELGELVESGASPGGQVPLASLERLSGSQPASKRDIAQLSNLVLKGQELDALFAVAMGFSGFKSQLDDLRRELAKRGESTYSEALFDKGGQVRLATT